MNFDVSPNKCCLFQRSCLTLFANEYGQQAVAGARGGNRMIEEKDKKG